MIRQPTVTLAMRQIERLKCNQAVIHGDLRPGRAAERLGITVQQIERLVIRYRLEGPIGLVSRHRIRPGNRGLKPTLGGHVLGILRAHAYIRPEWRVAGRRNARKCPLSTPSRFASSLNFWMSSIATRTPDHRSPH